jgi:regulatory protein RepA
MSTAPSLDKEKKAAAKADAASITDYLRGPKNARPTMPELTGTPYRAPMIVAGYLPQDAGGDVAPGGTGKSTLLIFEAVHIILGWPLYGRKIVRPGAALFITAEDSRNMVLGRLNAICRALELSKRDYARVRTNFYVEDVSACPAKIVLAGKYGAEQTAFVDEIVAQYKGAKLAVAILDPTSLLGPGEMSGNDGMSELMRTARILSQQLGAAVRLVHHVSQAVARGNIHDQYAGRGGTAFADNSRGQRQIVVLSERRLDHEGSTYELPAEVEAEDLSRGRVLAIFVHKLSYAERDSTPIVLVRQGFAYTHIPMNRIDKSPLAEAARFESHRNKLLDFIVERFIQGIKITKNELDEYGGTLGLTRKDLRAARDSLLHMKLLTERALPKDEQRTKRKRFLAPAGEPNPANPAESRHNPASGITLPTDRRGDNPAADGTPIRRRDSKSKKQPKNAIDSGPKGGESRRNSATEYGSEKGLNGQAVDHG